MSAHPHIDVEDLALYAMQLLAEDEAAAIGEHLEGCTTCREQVAGLQGDLTALAMTSEMQAPPASSRQRLMRQIGREKRVLPVAPPLTTPLTPPLAAVPERGPESYPDTDGGSGRMPQPEPNASDASDSSDGFTQRRARGSGAWRVLPWLGWAIAAGALVAAGDLYHQGEQMRTKLIEQSGEVTRLAADAAKGQALLDVLTDPAAVRVTLTQTPETPRPMGRATYVPDKGGLLFTASNLEPLQLDKTYELWILPADGHDPIPAGTFQPNAHGDASVILPELPKGVIAKAFGVTIEAAGGAQQPTLPIILVGAPT